MTSHVFTEATHVVSAPCGFACAVTHATYLYIPSFIEIRLRAFEPQQVEICPFPFLWLLAFTTSCTTVQGVIKTVKHYCQISANVYTEQKGQNISN